MRRVFMHLNGPSREHSFETVRVQARSFREYGGDVPFESAVAELRAVGNV